MRSQARSSTSLAAGRCGPGAARALAALTSLAALAGLAGCGAASAGRELDEKARAGALPASALAAGTLAAGTLAAGTLSASAPPPASTPPAPPPLPGPAPRPPLAPVAGVGLPTDDGCARCHDEIAAEWRGSLHRHAWQNPYFARSYAAEPQAFCRGCHAPSADPSAEPDAAARAAGVGCTTCHVVTEGIVGARAAPLREGGHAVLGDARLATPEACGGCHEFAFPDASGAAGAMQQKTLAEHRRSAAADTTCQACHMRAVPSRGGGTHRSHAFRVQGDHAMLAQAVEVASVTLGAGEVRMAIAPGEIGHAFPTGDVFRRVEVRVAPEDAAGKAMGPRSVAVLARSFGPARGAHDGVVRAERSDTRLTGPRTLTFSLSPAAPRARWQIVWQRLPPWLAERLGMAMSDNETVVLEGTVSR